MPLRRFIDRPLLHPYAGTSIEDPWAVRASADQLGAEVIVRRKHTTQLGRLSTSAIQITIQNAVNRENTLEREAEERRQWHQANPGRSIPAPLPEDLRRS